MRPHWLKETLSDPTVTDLCINGIHAVFVDKGKGMEPLVIDGPFFESDLELHTWILSELAQIGRAWDAKHPFIDAALPSGHRIHIAFPPASTSGLLISLRKLNSQTQWDPNQAIKRWHNSPLYHLLAHHYVEGDTLLLCGSTGSGKTTLAQDLLSLVPPRERIIALEDTPELHPQHPHFLSLNSRPANSDGGGEITLRTLLKQTLRMRPDRIVLGECRGQEVLELLQALNTGHGGSLATLHANSPRDGIRRLELLCLMASEGTIPLPAIRELISAGVQWIAHVHREQGKREISAVFKLEGREGDTILMRPMLG